MNDKPTDREAELASALAAERAARRAAEAALAERSDLIATVSHELRTPIGAILSMSDFLLGTELGDRQRHYADTLKQSAQVLLAILNDVLDDAKLTAGKLELAPEPVDVTAFFDGIETVLDVRCKAKGLTGHLIRGGADLPAHICIDPVRLRQLIDNLIDNAVKFTAQGSVSVMVTFEPTADMTGALTIAVHDTGIGIAEGDKEHLFKPYEQANASIAGRFGGTGLGLAIVKKLTELMHGEITCASKPGRGSIFTLTLPVTVTSPPIPATLQTGQPAPAETTAVSETICVLIVEDNQINQTLITTLLDMFGIGYVLARSGPEAIAQLGEQAFDLVLMDLRMPGMDGFEAARKIRALPDGRGLLPIIALTAQSYDDVCEAAHLVQFDGYVQKPIDAKILLEAINKALATPSAQSVAG